MIDYQKKLIVLMKSHVVQLRFTSFIVFLFLFQFYILQEEMCAQELPYYTKLTRTSFNAAQINAIEINANDKELLP